MPAVTIGVTIPAIKHGYGQRDQPESYTTNMSVSLGKGERVKIMDHEFLMEDLIEAVRILKEHHALRTRTTI